MDIFEDDPEFEDEDEPLADPEDDATDDDVTVTRMITAAPIDGAPIAKALDSLPSSSPFARELITMIQEMHQLLGDADAFLADKLRDLESGVRLLFTEFYQQPGVTLLGILSRMDSSEQLKQIETISRLLSARKERLNEANLGGLAK